MQQHRPGDRQFDVQSLREVASGIEKDAAAGHVDGLSDACFQDAPAPDQLPLHVQLKLVAPVLAAVTGDCIAVRSSLFPTHHGPHFFPSRYETLFFMRL